MALLFDSSYSPRAFVSDAADSIWNGYETVFRNQERIICWAHVYLAINKKLLHKSKSERVFDKVCLVLINLLNPSLYCCQVSSSSWNILLVSGSEATNVNFTKYFLILYNITLFFYYSLLFYF